MLKVRQDAARLQQEGSACESTIQELQCTMISGVILWVLRCEGSLGRLLKDLIGNSRDRRHVDGLYFQFEHD